MSAVDKLDVEPLCTAATRLRETADFPQATLWTETRDLPAADFEDAADIWIALMNPGLAEPLAAWLESEASRWHITNANLYHPATGTFSGLCSCGNSVTRPDRDTPAQCPRLNRALAVARLINGGAR